jgi:hypothetical protein
MDRHKTYYRAQRMSMKTIERKKGFDGVLFGGVILLVIGYILLHDLFGGTLLAHSNWDSYTLQAMAWRQGSLGLGQDYSWLELAVYNGDWYSPFPVVPTFVMYPLTFVFGGLTPNNLIVMAYAVISVIFAYLCFKNLDTPRLYAMFLAIVFVLGSNAMWMSANGGVWFQAQMLNLLLCFAGIYCLLKEQNTLSLALIALAVGCRPFSILLLLGVFLYLVINERRSTGKNPALVFFRQMRYLILPVLIGLGYLYFNYIRFGDWLDFGRAYLPEFAAVGGREFGLEYVLPNLYNHFAEPVRMLTDGSLTFPAFDGFMFFIANPIFIIWFFNIVKDIVQKKMPPEKVILIVMWVLNLLLLTMHKTMGGWQFGARYTVDLIPYVLLYTLFNVDIKVEKRTVFIGVFALMFNVYGALVMNCKEGFMM